MQQDEWYWQCQPGGNNNINTNNNGGNGGNENNGGKGIGMWQQCGGKGGECNKFGGCSDAAFRGASCSGGSVCKRQVGRVHLLACPMLSQQWCSDPAWLLPQSLIVHALLSYQHLILRTQQWC